MYMHSASWLKSPIKLALALVFISASTGVSADPFSTPAPVSVPGAAANVTGAPAELLDPDRAFQPQVRLRDGGTAEVKFDVVPGYYLYRDRIRIDAAGVPLTASGRKSKPETSVSSAVSGKGVALAVTLPHGRVVDDPTFGRVEIFDKAVTFTVDLNLASNQIAAGGNRSKAENGKTATKFVVTSQGCAKAGVCFPPQQHEFALPATVSKLRDSASAVWVPPVSAATSLSFGRPRPATEQSPIAK
jgi:thiol:disulfide interchange protein DsbD